VKRSICPAAGCGRPIPHGKAFCYAHWKALSHATRYTISRSWAKVLELPAGDPERSLRAAEHMGVILDAVRELRGVTNAYMVFDGRFMADPDRAGVIESLGELKSDAMAVQEAERLWKGHDAYVCRLDGNKWCFVHYLGQA
jgi:hypothetical protein